MHEGRSPPAGGLGVFPQKQKPLFFWGVGQTAGTKPPRVVTKKQGSGEDTLTTPWQREHWLALYEPQGVEAGIVGLLRAWADYADNYRETYDRPLGDHRSLGPPWQAIGHQLLRLLDGNLGRLDYAELESFILERLAAEGFTAP